MYVYIHVLVSFINVDVHIFLDLRSSEVVRGYDFLVNAVWPEIVSNIEARTHSIFAPGNPDVFHKVSGF